MCRMVSAVMPGRCRLRISDMSEILDIWPVAVAVSVIATGAYVVACKGFVRVGVDTRVRVNIEVGKQK